MSGLIMVSVYSAKSVTDAHLIRGLLESEGISAVVYGGDLQGGIGELPVMGLITVRVAENFATQACAIIADYERAEPDKL
jgi:hypothetical protein